mmetsp:Transcript_32028/g.54664  ORF Transcript_32028/g.54664 Transcript_32028/m.54664 type:complete len:82 (-) Transcript_32028:146-391(-)
MASTRQAVSPVSSLNSLFLSFVATSFLRHTEEKLAPKPKILLVINNVVNSVNDSQYTYSKETYSCKPMQFFNDSQTFLFVK